MNKFTLDIDAGNTCVKWRVRELPQAQGYLVDELSDGLFHILDDYCPARVFVASVRDDCFENEMQKLFARCDGIEFEILKVDPGQPGLRIAYRAPVALGVDRWLAAIGAQRVTGGEPCLIIDAGSAVTIDTVANGQFLGGYILPGFRMLQESLLKGTSRVRADIALEIELISGRLPQDTLEAVRYGSSMMLCAGVEKAARNFLGQWPRGKVLLTGGDGKRLAELLELECESFPNLVLDGIACIRP